MSIAGRIVALPIEVYRRGISPYLPPRCKFYPTCSTYAVEVLGRHGAVKGSLLTVARLARCHPWSMGGVDLPPRPGEWRAEPVHRMTDEELAEHWRCLDEAHHGSPVQKGMKHGVL